VGELAALLGVLDRKRAFFLLPLKAIVNDKHKQFGSTYQDFGIRVIRATGEIAADIPALMRGHYDISLLTYEKFASLALAAPHLLEQVGTIVIDEVQMIADPSRGANLEFLLTLLRMRRQEGRRLIASEQAWPVIAAHLHDMIVPFPQLTYGLSLPTHAAEQSPELLRHRGPIEVHLAQDVSRPMDPTEGQ